MASSRYLPSHQTVRDRFELKTAMSPQNQLARQEDQNRVKALQAGKRRH
jgi:hypothetical protein